MVFHNNKLLETPLFDECNTKRSQSPPRPPPRTDAGSFIKQEETSENKRKRLETSKIQTLHEQPAVDAARAADMDHIDFGEQFHGFNFPAQNAYNRSAQFYRQHDYHPWTQTSGDGSTFYENGMPDSDLSQSLSGDTLVPDSFVVGSYAAPEPAYDRDAYTYHNDAGQQTYQGDTYMSHPSNVDAIYHNDADAFTAAPFATGLDVTYRNEEPDESFTQEDAQNAQEEYTVSTSPVDESDFAASESEDERPRKAPKLNKDGAPRKPRQPRAKLLKWTDDDWKNVCLGIVWACGETGVQIPFEQAAQIVGEKCTAGALQQALLKLRGKQIAEGHYIPSLRMAWTRKNKLAASGAKIKESQEPEANRSRKKPTRVESTQAFLITIGRSYNDRDRQGMARPYKWKKLPRGPRSSTLQSPANVKQEMPAASACAQPEATHDYSFGPQTPCCNNDFLPATHTTRFGNNFGYLQGMDIAGGEFTNLLTTEGLHELGNGLADASDDVFSA